MNSDTMKAIALSQFDLLLSLRDRIAAGEYVNPDSITHLASGLASTVTVMQSERDRERRMAEYRPMAGILSQKVA